VNLFSLAFKNNATLKRWLWLLVPAFFLAGCNHDEIRVYNAPKDEPPRVASSDNSGTAPADDPHASMAELPPPQLTWKLPVGWKESTPNSMSLVAFSVPGTNGAEGAEVSIARLPNLAGKESLLVNMWRQTAGLTTLSDEEALKQLSPVEAGGEKGNLFEVAGNTKDGHPVEIVTAMVHRPDGSWFYKLAGDSSVVKSEKATFLDFIKSVRIQEAAPIASAAHAEEQTQDFHWTVPSDWKVAAHNQFQVARFSLPGKAEVFISVFPTDTGGTLANVNRWRGQIKLPDVTKNDLPGLVSPLDPSDSQSILVDMKSDGQRLIGAIVPRDGQYWFYKLLGDTGAVAAQRDAFIAFAKSKP
jgi:hypothetical protein